MVEAKDRGGEIGGNAATCSLEIKILDVNDNLPVVESRTVSKIMAIFSMFLHLPVSHNKTLYEIPCTGEMR